jgi:imidazolonepropionase-like amidohydrolase
MNESATRVVKRSQEVETVAIVTVATKMKWPKRLPVIILLFIISFLLRGGFIDPVFAQTSSNKSVIAFLHATVIPMDRERELPDQTVIISNGKIVSIGPASKVKVPKDALRVDATGRYLIPALCDMHVHVEAEGFNAMLKPEDQLAGKDIPFETFLYPYIANGVTTIQILSATHEHVQLQQRISRNEVLAPRLVNARLIDGPKKAWPPPLSVWVDSAAEARSAVIDAKKGGFDKIKVYSFLSKESYDSIISTAKEQHMDVIGHIPDALSVEYVVDAGQKMIAHTEEVAKHAHGDYSPERINYYADRIAKGNVWMTPTLVTTHSILELFDDPDGLRGRPEAVYYRHPMQLGIWKFITDNLYRPIPPQVRKKLTDDYEKFQKPFTKVFHDHGGKLMTGTDSLFPGLVPGFAVHRELHELVDVGLTPFEALRSSTTEPFEYLGEIDRAGTIEVGKYSDLVLVNEDPLKDVSGASKIAGVLIRGRWVGIDEITKRMKEIEISSKSLGR